MKNDDSKSFPFTCNHTDFNKRWGLIISRLYTDDLPISIMWVLFVLFGAGVLPGHYLNQFEMFKADLLSGLHCTKKL